MKFPLAERPYAPLRLSAEQETNFGRLVENLLLLTLREYDHFTFVSGGTLNKKLWKSVKHREGLSVYRERADRDDLAGPTKLRFDWSLPKLLMVGSVVGTLNDVMYGTIAPTAEAMRIRSTYVDDEVLDCDVLHEIKMPTPDSPFEFMGIKWAVRNHSSTLNPIVWPRDSVVIEATGVHTTHEGERIGYRVVHSVELPQCSELRSLGIVRTRMSSTSLSKQLPNGTVDVYMTRFTESSGSLPDSVALTAAAASMIGCWKSVWCSQNKKLAYAAKDGALKWARAGSVDKMERLVVTTDEGGKYCCGLCLKHYKIYNSVITCQACNLMVCSRCQVGRKLARIGYQGVITKYPVLFCKNCIARSAKESALDVARSECSPSVEHIADLQSQPRPAVQEVHQPTKRVGRPTTVSVDTTSTFTNSMDGLGTFEPNSFVASYDESEASSALEIQTVDDWDREHDRSFYMEEAPRLSASDTTELASYTPSERDPQRRTPISEHEHQQQLWKQISQLYMAAEETYRLTRKNADAMRHQMSAFS